MKKISNRQKTKLNELCLIFDVKLSSNHCWMNACWEILNKISSKHIISPIKAIETIKLFGIICFNNSEFNHPIDYLYDNIYIVFKKES